MAIVGIDCGSLYRQTHSLSRMAWSCVSGHLAPLYIHQMNRVNSCKWLCHDDSTINIVLELFYYYLLLGVALSTWVNISIECPLVIANFYFKVQYFVLSLGIVVTTCISARVPRTKHIPLHLACWAFVLHYQCVYSLSIIDFIHHR